MDAKKLEELMGFSPGELEATADAYEQDTWPDGKTVRMGRPPIADEPTKVISGRVGESVLAAFDAKARRHGQSRTERLRELITNDVLTA